MVGQRNSEMTQVHSTEVVSLTILSTMNLISLVLRFLIGQSIVIKIEKNLFVNMPMKLE